MRAVVTGFGFTLGASLFKRVSAKLGWEEAGQQTQAPPAPHGDGDGDDGDAVDNPVT